MPDKISRDEQPAIPAAAASNRLKYHNFSAGPSRLFDEVMEKAHESFYHFDKTLDRFGPNFMEFSHREPFGEVQQVMLEYQKLVKELLNVPDNYHILMMPGGAHQQFSAVMVNLCKNKPNESPPHYVDSGNWSRKAAAIAEAYCKTAYPEWYGRSGTSSKISCSTTSKKNGSKSSCSSSSNLNLPRSSSATSFCSTTTGGFTMSPSDEDFATSSSKGDMMKAESSGMNMNNLATNNSSFEASPPSSTLFRSSSIATSTGSHNEPSPMLPSRVFSETSSDAEEEFSPVVQMVVLEEDKNVESSKMQPKNNLMKASSKSSVISDFSEQVHGPLFCNKDRGCVNKVTDWQVREDAAYVFCCLNETIEGLEVFEEPDLALIDRAHIPLVADATSTLFSRPIDVSKYGVLFASAGKNLGPTGVCLVLVRDDLLSDNCKIVNGVLDFGDAVKEQAGCSSGAQNVSVSEEKILEFTSLPMMDWGKYAFSKPVPNIYNTPATYPLYLGYLTLKTTLEKGGMVAMEEKAKQISDKIYNFLDDEFESHGFYKVVVDKKFAHDRSRMNICFKINDTAFPAARELEKEFLEFAANKYNVHQLAGHPAAGGLRFTTYNAIPEASVDVALGALTEFRKLHAAA
ncbi:unnamed protein product [Amoebophrya sp. A120]|nr:unnamed protein product [Amoebophrya sp. A120]|eukprot:GSA120T00004011001.1